MYEVRNYSTIDGKDIFDCWLRSLDDGRAEFAVARRLVRIGTGNFGDHKFCGDGVWELRIDFGPGFRIYYAIEGECLILLLAGGSKRTQKADIKKAGMYLQDWRERNERQKSR